MWKYEKSLQYPVNIRKKNLKMAKVLTSQYGGSQGELAASLRYLNQRYTMPDDKGRALLTDIGTEELAHVEIVSAMVYQCIQGATVEEMQEAGLSGHYTEHGFALFPQDATGNPFTAMYISTTGDPIADLHENLAAEQKARVIYEYLMDQTNDPDILAPLSFLRQREVIHYHRFLELLNDYESKGIK